jgi:hypothetical protein
MAWIHKLRALVCQFLAVAERANPPKSKLFGAVACPKTGVMEFSHPLDKCSQARCHLQFSSLIVDMWQQQMLV